MKTTEVRNTKNGRLESDLFASFFLHCHFSAKKTLTECMSLSHRVQHTLIEQGGEGTHEWQRQHICCSSLRRRKRREGKGELHSFTNSSFLIPYRLPHPLTWPHMPTTLVPPNMHPALYCIFASANFPKIYNIFNTQEMQKSTVREI